MLLGTMPDAGTAARHGAFQFANLEGSTHPWQAHPEAAHGARARHGLKVRGAIGQHHGLPDGVIADAVRAAFPSAPEAVADPVAIQRRPAAESWAPAEDAAVLRSLWR